WYIYRFPVPRLMTTLGSHRASVTPSALSPSRVFLSSSSVRALYSLRPLAVVAVEDISETVDLLARNWRRGERGQMISWDLMHPDQTSLGATVEKLRD